MQITLDGKPKETTGMMGLEEIEGFLESLKVGECYTTYGLMDKLSLKYHQLCKAKRLLKENTILYGKNYIFGSKKTITEYKKALKA